VATRPRAAIDHATPSRPWLLRGLAVVVGLGIALALVEVAGRIFLALNPSYEVLFLEPDRVVGWKQLPGHTYTWTGVHWYPLDYTAPIEVNSLGFRDREHERAKPPGVVRIALLGDSFVEALQVPFARTAAHRLEAMLNDARTGTRWEVLNFGISNYGVGQYLLTWDEYARAFSPDVVFAFIADFHFARTVQRYESGAFRATRRASLWVRPTFRLEDGALIAEPARDFDAFVRLHRELIESEFSGRRSRVRERSVLGHYLRQWRGGGGDGSFAAALRDLGGVEAKPVQVRAVNLEILRTLNASVRAAGATLVLVDVSRYVLATSDLPTVLSAFAAREGAGYVPLHAALAAAQRAGRATRWAHDGHFNETGNEVFATAMYDWVRRERKPAFTP
jgi:hypothetical protein